jgi:pimeloyl-ACP methyl ester carboxylesterase
MMVIALWIASVPVALILAGALYQHLGSRRDRRRYSSPGRWVTTKHNCEVYLYEMGEGEPTVVFESGIGATHLNWRHIQQAVAPFAGTVAYDRCGLGWSGPCQTSRTPANIATELHQMLESAGIRPPFILVGHSFGGLVVRRYALLFPDEVAGVVLVDPMRCEEWPPLDPSKLQHLELGKKMIRYALPITQCGLARLAVQLLFHRTRKISVRLAGAAIPNGRNAVDRITTEVRKMPQAVWPVVAAHWSRPAFYSGLRCHLESIPETVREMHVAEPIRDIPITVLTPATAEPLNQNHLDHIGDSVQQVIAPNSAHWIHLDEPSLVIESIRALASGALSVPVTAPHYVAATSSAILEPSFPVQEF